MPEYISSDGGLGCADHCIYDAGHNCRLCERFENTVYFKSKIKVRKHFHLVEDLISFEDYIKATGLDEDATYQGFMDDCNFYWESDGDFIVHVSLVAKGEATQRLVAQLPDDVVKRDKLGVEYEQ